MVFEPLVDIVSEEDIDVGDIDVWNEIPGYEALYPVVPYEQCRPDISKVGDEFTVNVHLVAPVNYTENDAVYMRAESKLVCVPGSGATILVVWIDTRYIGCYEGKRLEHYQYLWRLDEGTQEFVVIDEEMARQLGLAITHDADIVKN